MYVNDPRTGSSVLLFFPHWSSDSRWNNCLPGLQCFRATSAATSQSLPAFLTAQITELTWSWILSPRSEVNTAALMHSDLAALCLHSAGLCRCAPAYCLQTQSRSGSCKSLVCQTKIKRQETLLVEQNINRNREGVCVCVCVKPVAWIVALSVLA